MLQAVASAMALVDAIRSHGHLAARLDPLGSEPLGDPALDESELAVPLPLEAQKLIPASILGVHVEGETLAEVLPRLREVYCGTIAYEIEHISDHAERAWLRRAIESGRFRRPLQPEQRRALLLRLAQVEAFETYLRRAFIGQKQFSIEGLDTLVPMLDEAIELAAAGGAHEIVIGIAHRGRLNVLTHVVGRSYASILREFEGERTIDALVSDPEGGTGDVKYHLSASETRQTGAGEVQVTLAANPSHLEAVDPVIEGIARAEQTDRSSGPGVHDPTVALAILVHGDASFAGQGVVAETFNLHSIDGYSTGGTFHVIANNQVGFTTDPAEGRSTRYSSDLAKGFDVPIVHVNADDPEAALAAARLALAYRESSATTSWSTSWVTAVRAQRAGRGRVHAASMAERIEHQAPVRETYAKRLVEEGVLTEEEASNVLEQTIETLRAAHDELRASFAQPEPPPSPGRAWTPAAASSSSASSTWSSAPGPVPRRSRSSRRSSNGGASSSCTCAWTSAWRDSPPSASGRESRMPAAVVCTSGTAVANLLPAGPRGAPRRCSAAAPNGPLPARAARSRRQSDHPSRRWTHRACASRPICPSRRRATPRATRSRA